MALFVLVRALVFDAVPATIVPVGKVTVVAVLVDACLIRIVDRLADARDSRT